MPPAVLDALTISDRVLPTDASNARGRVSNSRARIADLVANALTESP